MPAKDSEPPTFDRKPLAEKLTNLAAQGVYIGTSSWKYPGWLGQCYDESRYLTRGKFSETKFERECLTEYAETFKTVCVDAAYYRFPEQKYIAGMIAQVPDDFRFAFKVTDFITIYVLSIPGREWEISDHRMHRY